MLFRQFGGVPPPGWVERERSSAYQERIFKLVDCLPGRPVQASKKDVSQLIEGEIEEEHVHALSTMGRKQR